MSERDSLRVLRVLTAYLLIGCFLTGNVISACASSETSTDSGYSYGNETETSNNVEIDISEDIETEPRQDTSTSNNFVTESNSLAESDHPYANNYKNTWTISESGAKQIRLHFEYLKLAKTQFSRGTSVGYDTLILLDKYDNVLATYGRSYGGVNLQDFWTEWYTGDTLKVKLITDSSGTANGFIIDKTETRMDETSEPSEFVDEKSSNPSGSSSSEHPKPKQTEYLRPKQTEKTENNNEGQSSASVQLYGEKTDVTLGEDILLRLSAVNLITKPTMSIQVILLPPSGMSVTSSEFVNSGAGQYTTTYELEPGQGKDIEIRIKSNQVGNFDVNGRVIYYFDGDPDNAEDYTLNLPIKVKEGIPSSSQLPSTDKENAVQSQNQTKSPGFGSFIALLGLLTICTLKKRIL